MHKNTSYPGDGKRRGHLTTKRVRSLLSALALATLAFLTVNNLCISYSQSKYSGLQTKGARNYTYYVPFPYHISKWSLGGTQFYHTMQCVWTGIAAANVDPEFAARHPEQIAFVAAKDGPFPRWSRWWRIYKQDRSRLVRSIEKAFWQITDVISYEELINGTRADLAPLQPDFLRIAHDSNRACRGYRTSDAMDWFSRFLNAKFDETGRTRFDDGFNNVTSRNCSATSIRTKIKALLLNRPSGSRHISDDTITELLSHSDMTSWTYRSDLASYSLLEQLRVFESHNLIVLPHGAAESNVVASSRWHSDVGNRSHVPATVVELCPPYAHCSCVRVCPDFYKNRMIGTAYFGIVFEKKGLNCERFCAAAGFDMLKRVRIKRKLIPNVAKQIVSTLTTMIDAEIIPRLASYCRGDRFDLKNTTIKVVEI